MPLRVLMVDDHPVYRSGMRAQLSLTDVVDLVGEAATGLDAVTAAAELHPDVVLMDLQIPGIDGIEATRRILATDPSVGVVMLTMFDDDESVLAAVRAGARGYLLKGSAGAAIVRAIEAVASGEAVFGPTIARRIADRLAPPTRPPHAFPA